MADSSLDDFFAKKDKSKKTKKFTTTEQIAKKLEEGGKKTEKTVTKKEKEKSVPLSSSTVVGSTIQQSSAEQDEEWREFEEKETDYTGLKIQNLQIGEFRDEDQEKDKSDEQMDDGDQLRLKDGSRPWSKGTGPSPSEPTKPIVETPVAEPLEEKPGKYIAPNMRGSAGGSQHGSRKLRNKSAPEIDSEEHFPSLSVAAEIPKSARQSDRSPDSESRFESVKRGSRNVDDVGVCGPKLDLGNKFDGLNEGETS